MPDSDIRIAYSVGRAHAQQHGQREKALAYITRRPDELLVFAHTEDYPDSGIQVPAGGVEPGEEPADAVVRETFEESGLKLADPVYLGSFQWPTEAPSRIRHFYWLQAPLDNADHWEHRVTAGQEDKGMIFRYSFAARSNPGLLPLVGFDSGLDDLERAISEKEQVGG